MKAVSEARRTVGELYPRPGGYAELMALPPVAGRSQNGCDELDKEPNVMAYLVTSASVGSETKGTVMDESMLARFCNVGVLIGNVGTLAHVSNDDANARLRRGAHVPLSGPSANLAFIADGVTQKLLSKDVSTTKLG